MFKKSTISLKYGQFKTMLKVLLILHCVNAKYIKNILKNNDDAIPLLLDSYIF